MPVDPPGFRSTVPQQREREREREQQQRRQLEQLRRLKEKHLNLPKASAPTSTSTSTRSVAPSSDFPLLSSQSNSRTFNGNISRTTTNTTGSRSIGSIGSNSNSNNISGTNSKNRNNSSFLPVGATATATTAAGTTTVARARAYPPPAPPQTTAAVAEEEGFEIALRSNGRGKNTSMRDLEAAAAAAVPATSSPWEAAFQDPNIDKRTRIFPSRNKSKGPQEEKKTKMKKKKKETNHQEYSSSSSSSPGLVKLQNDTNEGGKVTTSSSSSSTSSKSRRRKLLGILLCLFLFVLALTVGLIVARQGNKDDDNDRSASSFQASDGILGENGGNDGGTNAQSPPSPTPPPPPTTTPTLSPTQTPAVTTIRVIKSKYRYEESIPILFQYADSTTNALQPIDPIVTDQIAIYRIDDDDNMDDFQMMQDIVNRQEAEIVWFPACNAEEQSSCQQFQNGDDNDDENIIETSSSVTTTSQGQINFGSIDDTMSWPLEPGTFRAFLIRTTSFTNASSSRQQQQPGQKVVLATSQSFTIDPDLLIHRILPTIDQIEQEIRQTMIENPKLGPKYVRLGFHDCAGHWCDGCVDMTFHDNAGLEPPLAALAPIVQRHENTAIGISRADIWAYAALLGADVAQERSSTKVDFSLEYIGRLNCEDRLGVDGCMDKDGNPRKCSAELGPHVHLPEPDITTQDLFHFFDSVFDFNVQETVALMGAHTLGELNRTNLGFPGPNGWVRDNQLLDNDYFIELVGERGSTERLVELAPPWFRFDTDNSDLEGIPDRKAWHAFPPAFDGNGNTEIVMLNADIALVRELTEDNMRADGRVSCSFIERVLSPGSSTPRCPHAAMSLEIAADYKFDNELWLNDFEKVYKKMLHHGYRYNPDKECRGGLCIYQNGL